MCTMCTCLSNLLLFQSKKKQLVKMLSLQNLKCCVMLTNKLKLNASETVSDWGMQGEGRCASLTVDTVL